MKNYLYSKIEALAEIDKISHKLSFAKPIILENGALVKIFPLENNYLPFCFEVGKENLQIKTIQFANFNILELQLKPIINGEYYKNKTIKDGMISVVGIPYKLNIEFKGKAYSKLLNNNLKDIEFKELKNAILLTANVDESDYVVIFHKTSKTFLELLGNVDISDKNIKAITSKNTFAQHGELAEYEITDSSISTLSIETVYLNGCPALTPPFLTHIAFFEAVKVKDYNLAKSYLTTELKNNLTTTHFETFFENFDEIKPLKENNQTKIALLYKQTENKFLAKVFVLEFQQNKISNIIEED